MLFLFFNIAFAASKITLYFEKSEFLDHLSVKCFYRELSRDGQKVTIIKDGTIYSCPKTIKYDPETGTWE